MTHTVNTLKGIISFKRHIYVPNKAGFTFVIITFLEGIIVKFTVSMAQVVSFGRFDGDCTCCATKTRYDLPLPPAISSTIWFISQVDYIPIKTNEEIRRVIGGQVDCIK